MKKFLFLFLLVAAVASAFTFVRAEEQDMEGKKFVIHGEVRERADYNDNFLDFTDDSSDSYLIFPYRARVGAEGHFGKNVVGYVEFQNFGEWGNDHPPKGGSDDPFGNDNEFNNVQQVPVFVQDISTGFTNEVQLYEGWVALNKVAGSRLSLKFGRQEIVKGSEMLLGDKDFYNGQSFDGVTACWQWDKFDLDVFYTRPSQSFSAGVPNHQSVNFWGAWAQWGKWDNGADAAAYALYYEDGTHAVTAARRAFWTVGGRTSRDVTGKNAFNWNAEIAFQSGDQQDGAAGASLGDTKSIGASALEGMIEYNLHSGSLDHRFHLAVAMASGDKDSTDGDAEAFDPLFQDSHARYGYSDLVQLSDLQAWNVGYNVRVKDHQFGADIWQFTLAEEVPISATSNEDDIGQELDLWWKYQYSKNTQITGAVAWFDPGKLFDFPGFSADPAVRLYGNLRLRF